MASFRRVGGVGVEFVAGGSATFRTEVGKNKASVIDFGEASKKVGRQTISEVQGASAAVRLMEGGWTNNLRASERFLANVLRLGPILQAAFPIVGAAAFLGLMVKLAEEGTKFWDKLRDAPMRSDQAFRGLLSSLRLTNDELKVTNDRLANDIAKLEGHRQNMLVLALDQARQFADKLADSLDKDLEKLHDLLEKQEIAWYSPRHFGGEGTTTDLKEQADKWREEIASTAAVEKAKIEAAATRAGSYTYSVATGKTTAQQLPEAQRRKLVTEAEEAGVTRIAKKYDNILATLQKMKDEASKIAPPASWHGLTWTPGDQSEYKKQINSMMEAFRGQKAYALEDLTNVKLTTQKEQLQGDLDEDKKAHPLRNLIDKMTAEVAAAKANMVAIGAGEEAKIVAAATAEALKGIEAVNEKLKARKKLSYEPLTLESPSVAPVKDLALQQQRIAVESKWGEELFKATLKVKEEVKAQAELTAAVGKGAEATKEAQATIAAIKFITPEVFFDKDWMTKAENQAIFEKAKADERKKIEAGRITQAAEAADKLGDQIALERTLATVQSQGAEAIRLATLAYEKKLLIDKYGVEVARQLIATTYALSDAQRMNTAAANIAGIELRIEANRRLAGAILQGAAAARTAAEENKRAEMVHAGATPEEIQKEIQLMRELHETKVSEEAFKTTSEYEKQLESLNDQLVTLENVKKVMGDSLANQIEERRVRDEILKIEVDEQLQMRTAQAGVRAFFLEMQESAKSAAAIIYETMNKMVDDISSQFAKLATGQKTSFGKMFQGLGESAIQSTTKSAMQTGLGKLGEMFGIKGLGNIGAKRGDSESVPLFVKVVGFGAAIPGVGGGGGGSATGGGAGGGIINILRKLGIFGGPPSTPPFLPAGAGAAAGAGAGAAASAAGDFGTAISTIPWGAFGLAEGGSMTAGDTRLVGEQGPELFRASSAGSISSNSDTRRMSLGGDSHVYNIDARGTDPVVVESRVKQAIIAAHNSAITTSIQAQHDQARRTVSPRRG